MTTKIYSGLEEPKSLWLPNSKNSLGDVRGVLNLSYADVITKANAECFFRISLDWMDTPPAVFCREAWIKRGEDWHVSPGFQLCYVLDSEWHDNIKKFISRCSLEETENIAAFWCLRNVRALLYNHRQVFDLGIDRWPGKWAFWDHGDRGREEYAASKLKRR
ncbi:MAG: hypothetical protein PHN49_00195 [Candidatus Omnitrophica bacterium]|nr:hypothetical protein [Candidatus Omnitrophota bacterium]